MSHIPVHVSVMIRAARKAARIMQRDFPEVQALQVSRKGPAEFVARTALAAGTAVLEELSAARPRYGVVMQGRKIAEGHDNSNRWIVSPLDGMENFLHGLPYFSISIALERDRQPYAGVIYSPVPDELFWARKGDGAFLNDRRLRVSGRHSPEQCLFACASFLPDSAARMQNLRETGVVMEKTAGVRFRGAPALDLACVAAGRFDAFWGHNLDIWNIAAGAAIIREAGGLVSQAGKGSGFPSGGSVLASNGHVHEAARGLIRQAADMPPDGSAVCSGAAEKQAPCPP